MLASYIVDGSCRTVFVVILVYKCKLTASPSLLALIEAQGGFGSHAGPWLRSPVPRGFSSSSPGTEWRNGCAKWRRGCAGRYLPATRRVPVAPLQQLNLKVSPAVLDHWRAQAAAQGVSIRDWLVSIAGPAAAPSGGPAAPDGLADRVAQLEAATAELREAVAQLEARPPRSPRPAADPPAAPVSPPADLSADGIETAALADRLGVKRGTLNNRINRLGGPAPGLVVDGWRCLGTRPPERGGPPRALWVPAGD
jgi:hypothetical protein